MKKNVKTYVVLGLTIGTVLTSGSTVFAGTTDIAGEAAAPTKDKGVMIRMESFRVNGEDSQCISVKADFSKYVEDGIISQETADKMAAYMEKLQSSLKVEMISAKSMAAEEQTVHTIHLETKHEKTDLYAQMVNEGIITQSEADAIKAAGPAGGKQDAFFISEAKHEGHGGFGGGLGKIDLVAAVEEGLISQETADNIAVYLEKQQATIQAEMEKVKDMTAEERAAYFENNKGERQDFLTNLVGEGLLTQTEADAIKAALPERHRANFSNLAEEGILSQETVDKMAAYMEERRTECKTEMETVKNLTADEKKAYFENKQNERTDMITDMVKAGVLTQAEAAALQTAMPMQISKTEK